MPAAMSHASTSPSLHRSGYRLTLLPRPDLVGPADAVGTVERHRRLALCADACVALTLCGPLASMSPWSDAGPGRWVVAMLLPALWMAVLGSRGCYRAEVLTGGTRECLRAMAGAVLLAAALLGALLIAVPPPMHRLPLVDIAAAVGALGVGTGLARRMVRRSIARHRCLGRGVRRTVVVGSPEPVARVITDLDSARAGGLVAIGAYLKVDRGDPASGALADEILQVVDDLMVDVVVMAGGAGDGAGLAGSRGQALASGVAARGGVLLWRPDPGGPGNCRRILGSVACGTVRGALAAVQPSRFAQRRPR